MLWKQSHTHVQLLQPALSHLSQQLVISHSTLHVTAHVFTWSRFHFLQESTEFHGRQYLCPTGEETEEQN